MRLLLVEDEDHLAQTMRRGLEAEGFAVSIAPNGEDGVFQASDCDFDLAILDVNLPGRDGFQVLAALRRRQPALPVLMVTARDAVEDRVRALDGGADDYLIKPFAFPELVARVRALTRRTRAGAAARRCALGELELDFDLRTVRRGGRELAVTGREFELLHYLVTHAGRVVSREMLARDIWREPARHTPLDNVIDVHIARLRRKLDEPFPDKLLHTVRGVGFRLGPAGAGQLPHASPAAGLLGRLRESAAGDPSARVVSKLPRDGRA